MIWALVACAATACWCAGAQAQPLTCRADEQCEAGFYCDRDAAYICRRCLDCEQLKREAPVVPSRCIKSVAECGSCITGLVEDLRGDATLQCVPADARSDDAAIPAYVWVIVSVVSLLLFALVVFIVSYVLRNTYTFKILASTRASVQSPRGAGGGLGAAASAPEMPPPYNAHYSAVRAHSPPPGAAPALHDVDQHHAEESFWPFIKRTPSGHGAGDAGGARESAGSQAAYAYNDPNYVRRPQLPPSYDGAGAGADALSASEEERDVFTHDEVTMESTWMPNESFDDDANAAGGATSDLSSQLDAARISALVRAPHTHPPCGWQDSNNNRNASEQSGTAGSSGAPALIINVVQTIHTAQPPPRNHEFGS